MSTIKINGQDFPADVVQKMIDAGIPVNKNNPSSSTPNALPPYGPYPGSSSQYGVFDLPGVRPDMWQTLIRKRSMAQLLGINRSNFLNEKIGIMTGVTDGSGDNASAFCGTDAPTPGQVKRCVQNYVFGEYKIKTRVDSLADMGLVPDRTHVEKLIINQQQMMNPFVPDDTRFTNLDSPIERRLAVALFELGVEIERGTETVLIQGNRTTASASTERGFIQEFDGLSRQIVTGRTDLDSGVACPAADSVVESFSANISGTASDGRDIVQTLQDMIWGIQDTARNVGMADTEWALVIHPRMWRPLVEYWACNFSTSRCDGTAGNPNNQNASEVERLRLQMLNGMYLLVEGMQVPVVLSEGMESTRISAQTSTFRGDIFYVPVRWRGRDLLRLEYKPMDNADARDFVNFTGTANEVMFMNNGLYMVTQERQTSCIEFYFMMQARLILETPFLAGRIDDVNYQFLAPWRASDPADTIAYVNGGTTYWDGSYSL